MVEGVHFLPTDPPETIGRKLLRVNLSDLAAMGATPLGYLLTVSVPKTTPKTWFEAFTEGLAHDQIEFALTLLGGDTTSTPGPISLSATILGHVAPGTAVTRSGARPGDGIWVTGTIGDGALGLRAQQGEIPDPTGHLADRYQIPQPRIALKIAGIASAAMDISDGLLQDLGHLCRASGVGATIHKSRVPLSPATLAAGDRWRDLCFTGGDDYELLLAIPRLAENALRDAAGGAGIQVTRIGECSPGAGEVTLLDEGGQIQAMKQAGWSHF